MSFLFEQDPDFISFDEHEPSRSIKFEMGTQTCSFLASEVTSRRLATVFGAREPKLGPRRQVSTTKVSTVEQATEELGPQAGRRYVKGHLNANKVNASTPRIASAMKILNPAAHTSRYHGVYRLTNPVPYRAEYFGHRLHADQNEKLVMYGCTIVAAIDGYSGFVPSYAVMAEKSNTIIYERVFRKAILEYGMWDTIVVDKGNEFVLPLAVQRSLAGHRTNTNRVPTRQLDSMQNNRIERFWPEVNSRLSYILKRALNEMVDGNQLNMADPIQKFSCSEATQKVVSEGLNVHVRVRNHHYIPGRGIPVKLMQRNFNTYRIDPSLVPTVQEAMAEYNANGGRIAEPLSFGTDPFFQNPLMQAAREAYFGRFHYSSDEVYRKAVNEHTDVFKAYVLEHVRVNIGLVRI